MFAIVMQSYLSANHLRLLYSCPWHRTGGVCFLRSSGPRKRSNVRSQPLSAEVRFLGKAEALLQYAVGNPMTAMGQKQSSGEARLNSADLLEADNILTGVFTMAALQRRPV